MVAFLKNAGGSTCVPAAAGSVALRSPVDVFFPTCESLLGGVYDVVFVFHLAVTGLDGTDDPKWLAAVTYSRP